MRILVTNDDGIHAEGLPVLERVARGLSNDVWVVAPETDQSGVAHSLTLNDPLRLRAVDERRYAVRGTPTDCVIMGVRTILPEPPELVLSGVNRGQNVADDVTYSGTIAAAMEGTLLGIRSIAVSQAYGWETRAHPHYDTAEAHLGPLLDKLAGIDLPPATLLNVNGPNRRRQEIAGVRVTRQGKRQQDGLYVDERRDGRGNPYYWLAFRREVIDPAPETDLHALAEGYISVTPLTLDLTARQVMETIARHL